MQDEFEKLVRTEHLMNARKFSKMTGLPSSTLIFYDREDVLAPAARDPFTNSRYYAPQQLVTVNFIKQCLYWGIHLSEIKPLLAERSPMVFRKFLTARRRVLIEQLQSVKEQLSAMNVYAELIDDGMMIEESEIHIRYMDSQRLRIGGENKYSSTTFYETLSTFLNEIPESARYLPVVGYFSDPKAYFAAPTQPTRFAVIDPSGSDERPEGKYLVGYARGYFGQRTDLPERLKAHVEKHGVRLVGAVYKTYLHDEMCVEVPNQYLFQVAMSVAD